MKQLIILTLLILLSLSSVCSSQESYSDNYDYYERQLRLDFINQLRDCQNKNDSLTSVGELDLDTIGMALLKGLEYRELYTNEVLLTKVLKYEISLWQEKSTNKDLVIERLATELSEQPTFISTHDWKITILISTLTAILTVITTVQLVK